MHRTACLSVVVFAFTVGIAQLATAAEPPLMAGVASADITPPPGLLMWGYSNRPQGATGKLDPLMAKVLVLGQGDTRVAIVALDLGRTPEDPLLAELRERVLSKHGVGKLLITASHTHAAPSLESTDGTPNTYGPTVIDALDKAIGEATSKLVPVRIGVGRGNADLAHNRRHYLPDGRVAMQWRNVEHEPTSPVDKQFVVVRLDRQDGKPLATLLHYACHPVVLGPDNLEYSADYVGTARAMIEKEFGGTCLFLQGGCGNINPYVDKTPRDQGGVEAMRTMGNDLGRLVVATARATKTTAADKPTLKFKAQKVPVRLRWDVQDPEVKAILGQVYGPRFDRYLAGQLKQGQIDAVLSTVLIDDAVALVGMPGEMFVEFQTALKERSPVTTTLLVGYANGYHAYFPTIRDAAAGVYGVKTATYVAPGAGERLTDEALVSLYKLTDKLHDVPRAEDFKLLEYDEIKQEKTSQIDAAGQPQIVSVSRIWDKPGHNAFTDLIRFQDRWYCVFRESEAHVGGDGKIRVLKSSDGDHWESAILLRETDVDLRDPKLSITADGRLMVCMGGSVYRGGKKLIERQPRVAFTTDGHGWTLPERVLAKGDWLWRVTWNNGLAYGVSYRAGPKNAPPDEEWPLTLYSSDDGRHYKKITLLDVPGRPGETTLRFLDDGQMVALVRREAGDQSGWIGTSRKPYTQWEWHPTGERLGGPNFIVLPDGSMWADSRSHLVTGAPKTVLARLTTTSYQPQLTLESGGDTSYPGMVWHDGLLWISYYSSHEGHSCIYLAKIRLPENVDVAETR